MELGEHSPSQGKPAKLPIVLCERPLSHLGAWSAYGAVWWEWAVRSGGLQRSLHMLHHGHIPRQPPSLTLQTLNQVAHLPKYLALISVTRRLYTIPYIVWVDMGATFDQP